MEEEIRKTQSRSQWTEKAGKKDADARGKSKQSAVSCKKKKSKKTKFYGMRNDYMFHAVLQKKDAVLRNLLAALLEMEEEEIVSCQINNPIEPGKQMDGKECILDVKLTLNNSWIINIELQVYRQTYWVSRSLLYWSRAYDNIKSGQDYEMLLPTCHIGILDFTLFSEHPKFIAEYRIEEVEEHYEYSDKLSIRVLDLTQTEKAKTCPDTNKRLLRWAEIFKAETMEELEQLTQGEEALEEMTLTIRELNENDRIRMQCEAREDYECRIRSEYDAGKKDGIEEGIKFEKKNTLRERRRAERERRRAEREIKRAEALRQRIEELERERK